MAELRDEFEQLAKSQGTSSLSDEFEDMAKQQTPVMNEPSQIEDTLSNQAIAAGIGAAKGLTLNFSDRMEAAARAAVQDESYDTLLRDIRERNKAYSEKFPITSTAGEIGGGVAGLFAGGALARGAGALAKGAGLAAEAAGVGSKALQTGEVIASGAEAAQTGKTLLTGAEAAKAAETSGSALLNLMKGTGLGESIKTGAALGGIASVGAVEDLTQSPSKTIDEALTGAATGGAVAGAGHIIGKSVLKATDIFKKFPAAREYVKGAEDAKFVRQLEKEGKEVSSLYDDSYKKLADLQGEVESTLIDKVNRIDSQISKGYDAVFDTYGKNIQIQPEEFGNLYKNIATKLDERRILSSLAPEMDQLANILQSPALDGSPRSLSKAMRDLQNLSDRSRGNKNELGARLFSDAKQSLKSMFIDKLPEEGQKLYQFTDNQYRAMSNLRNVNLKIPKLLDKEFGDSISQAEYKDSVKSLSKKFEMAAKGSDQSILDIDDALRNMSKIENDIIKQLPDNKNITAETPEIFKGIMDRAHLYEASSDLVKGSLLATDKTAGLAHSSVARNVGYGAGTAVEATKEAAADISRAAIHDINKLAFSAPEKVMNKVQEMAASPDPNVVKFAMKIKAAMQETDLSKRRAMLYVLSQQSGAYMSKEKAKEGQ